MAFISGGTHALSLSWVQRSAGPARVRAAATMPPGSRIGAETARMVAELVLHGRDLEGVPPRAFSPARFPPPGAGRS